MKKIVILNDDDSFGSIVEAVEVPCDGDIMKHMHKELLLVKNE